MREIEREKARARDRIRRAYVDCELCQKKKVSLVVFTSDCLGISHQEGFSFFFHRHIFSLSLLFFYATGTGIGARATVHSVGQTAKAPTGLYTEIKQRSSARSPYDSHTFARRCAPSI